jgi:hypothetical protein
MIRLKNIENIIKAVPNFLSEKSSHPSFPDV